jgi:hypothetical protein
VDIAERIELYLAINANVVGDNEERELLNDALEEFAALTARLAAAEAALKPFAEVARGIPDNWPGQCHLRIDSEPVQLGDFIGCREWLCYHGVEDCQDVCLPTIEQWRKAAKEAHP